MKASEIFLEYVEPLSELIDEDTTPDEMQELYEIPLMVWNSINLNNESERKSKEIPKILKNHLKLLPRRLRSEMRKSVQFWVSQKDEFFSEYAWLIEINVYLNEDGDIKIQAKVPIFNDSLSNYPTDWLNELAKKSEFLTINT